MENFGALLSGWGETMSAFFAMKPAGRSDDAAGLAVRLGNGRSVLDWQPVEDGGKFPPMDVAEWDGAVLTIPGPAGKGRPWKDLTDHFIWKTKDEPGKPGKPDMIGCLIRTALIKVHGEERGGRRWERVRGRIPEARAPKLIGGGDRFCWSFGVFPETVSYVAFPYPFKCAIANRRSPLLKSPYPGELIGGLAKENHRGAIKFAQEIAKAWSFPLSKGTRRKLAELTIEGRLEQPQ